ncbi:MAG: alpha/beta fold hydrolase [Alphaproteobacteria bacterium]|nr:alpha/beta fold hydrolase [Alphaproteobacteria bacterium]
MTEPASQATLDALLARCREVRTPCGDGHLMWRVWGADTPDRPAVVLLHGGFGAWNHWVRTIPSLEPHYRVIAPDLPGCGDSADPPQPYDAASLASLLSGGLDVLVADDAAFDLVSFSFGGVLSGLIARAQARRIRSLTLVGTPILGLTTTGPANQLVRVPPELSPEEAAPLYRGNLQKLMVRDPAAVDDLAMTLHAANMTKTRLRSRSIARTFVTAGSLHDLPCRLSCIFGDGDVTLHPDLASIRAHVAEIHPGAGFHVIPDAGHWVQYEASQTFNALLLDMLAEASEKVSAAD